MAPCVAAFALLAGCNAAPAPANSSLAHPAGIALPDTGARTGNTPPACTPAFNAKLAGLISQPPANDVDNVGVCGVEVRAAKTQSGGEHGSHQVLSVLATMPSGQQYNVEVVSNDDLDGVVTANPGDAVIAFGQGYVLMHGQYVAGVHDVHCSTHAGALNGYVNVAGRQYPASCPPEGQFHGDRQRN